MKIYKNESKQWKATFPFYKRYNQICKWAKIHTRRSIKLLAIISVNRRKLCTIPHSCRRCWRKRFKQQRGNIDHLFEYGARLPAWVPRRGWGRKSAGNVPTHVSQPWGWTATYPSAAKKKKKKRQGLNTWDRLFDLWGCKALGLRLTADAWNKQASPSWPLQGLARGLQLRGGCSYGNKCPGMS